MIPSTCQRCSFVAFTEDERDAHDLTHPERRVEGLQRYSPERREQIRESLAEVGRGYR